MIGLLYAAHAIILVWAGPNGSAFEEYHTRHVWSSRESCVEAVQREAERRDGTATIVVCNLYQKALDTESKKG
jgi:hypothetical protein